ncbi:MAG: UDP-N-acetylmuramate dehydrogenase [Bdellovibrionales bacterium]|nr:UDP-N-acetylmuramate dehydrogenase [Bdellovibrionales bacterium]
MDILENVALKDYTFWKIGGPADYFCLPTNSGEVREAVEWARSRGVAVTVLGGGTNVLVSDRGVEGLVLCMRKFSGVKTEERDGRLVLEATAGSPKSELTKQFLKRKLAPALFLCGLPGDVGGGVVMNAGVAEAVQPREFVEITDWVEILDLQTLQVRRLQKSEVTWTYRHTSGWQPGIVLAAGISWPLQADEEIPRKVKDATKVRLSKQPLELPSCGSTFKNPKPHSAGALIDQAGLKGYQVGGAQVSPKHANFIVNVGGAKADDVKAIIDHVKAVVRDKFRVELETEVKFLGRWA